MNDNRKKKKSRCFSALFSKSSTRGRYKSYHAGWQSFHKRETLNKETNTEARWSESPLLRHNGTIPLNQWDGILPVRFFKAGRVWGFPNSKSYNAGDPRVTLVGARQWRSQVKVKDPDPKETTRPVSFIHWNADGDLRKKTN